jgi:hypothetical protein
MQLFDGWGLKLVDGLKVYQDIGETSWYTEIKVIEHYRPKLSTDNVLTLKILR